MIEDAGGVAAELDEMIERLLRHAARIARAGDAAELAELVRALPARNPGGTGLELVFEPGAAAGSEAGGPSERAGQEALVLCRGVPAGRVRVRGGEGARVGAALLNGVAALLGSALENQAALADALRRIVQLEMDGVYFEQLFDVSPEAIVVLGGDDRVLRTNREFERLFGYTAAEAVGRTINELIVPDHLRDDGMTLTQRVAAGENVQAESVRRRRDGELLHVSMLATPIVDRGNQVAVYVIYRDITAQKDAEEALRRLSTVDELTGLFNRRGFFLLAEQQRRLAIRKRAELLLLYIDIDEFKLINDNHGHLVGDRVLADLGQLLRSCYRDSDIMARVTEATGVLARMGGDEFVVLAVDAGEHGDEILSSRLRERLRSYNAASGHPFEVSLSIGAVRVAPDPQVTIDSLIASADRLMYEAKRERLRGS